MICFPTIPHQIHVYPCNVYPQGRRPTSVCSDPPGSQVIVIGMFVVCVRKSLLEMIAPETKRDLSGDKFCIGGGDHVTKYILGYVQCS